MALVKATATKKTQPPPPPAPAPVVDDEASTVQVVEVVARIGAISDTHQRDTLARLMSEARLLAEQAAGIEAKRKEIILEAGLFAEGLGLTKVIGEGTTLFKTRSVSKTVSAEKLLALGVKKEVVKAATVVKQSKPYWKTAANKQTADGNGDEE